MKGGKETKKKKNRLEIFCELWDTDFLDGLKQFRCHGLISREKKKKKKEKAR